MKLSSGTKLLATFLGLVLVVLLYAEAARVIDEDEFSPSITNDVDDEIRRLLKRDADDGSNESKSKRIKRKKPSTTTMSPTSSTTGAPDSSMHTSTSTVHPMVSSTSTGHPGDSTTKKMDVTPDPDEEAIQEALMLQREEKHIIEEMIAQAKKWVGWLVTHDSRSRNSYRANQALDYISKIVNKYAKARIPPRVPGVIPPYPAL